MVLPIVQSVITTANNLGAFAKHSPRVFAHAVLIVFTAFFLIGGSTFVNTDTNVQPSSTIVVRSNSINESRSITDDATNIEIAAEVAAQVKLPVAQDVIQYAQVVKAESITSVASSEDALVKPQLVTTNGLEDKEVTTYTVKDGESIDRIASKFDISANTIRWANDISEWSDVTAGQKITILPVNGVIHRVGAGDTPSSLAEKYNVDAESIISFNDAEVDGLRSGSKIVIPGGVREAVPAYRVPTNSYVANAVGYYSGAYGAGYKRLSTPGYANNSYDYGWCTWWAAHRATQLGNPVPRFLGNANQWTGSRTKPVVGAVAQHFGGGLGHVAVVEAVSADGSMIKYSDMNGLAGWGNAAVTTDWVPVTSFATYLVF